MQSRIPPNKNELLKAFNYRKTKRQVQQLLDGSQEMPSMDQFATQVFADFELLNDPKFMQSFADLMARFYSVPIAVVSKELEKVSPGCSAFFAGLKDPSPVQTPEPAKKESPQQSVPTSKAETPAGPVKTPAKRGRKSNAEKAAIEAARQQAEAELVQSQTAKAQQINIENFVVTPSQKEVKATPSKLTSCQARKKEPDMKTLITSPMSDVFEAEKKQVNPRLMLWKDRETAAKASKLNQPSCKEVIIKSLEAIEADIQFPRLKADFPLALSMFPIFHPDFQLSVKYPATPTMKDLVIELKKPSESITEAISGEKENELALSALLSLLGAQLPKSTHWQAFAQVAIEANTTLCPAACLHVSPETVLSMLMSRVDELQADAGFVNAYLEACLYFERGGSVTVLDLNNGCSLLHFMRIADDGEEGNIKLSDGSYMGSGCIFLTATKRVGPGDELVLENRLRWQREKSSGAVDSKELCKLVHFGEKIKIGKASASQSSTYKYKGFCQDRLSATSLCGVFQHLQAKLLDTGTSKEDAVRNVVLDFFYDGAHFVHTAVKDDSQTDLEELRNKKAEQLEKDMRYVMALFFEALNESEGIIRQNAQAPLCFANLLGW